MDGELAALNQKLDLLTKQVQYLTEQAELAARRRAERDELIHDLTPIVNDVFRLTTEQLEEVQSYVDLGDLLRFLKRLLRNGRNFDRMLDQLESLMDLAQTVGPLTDSAFEKAADWLQRAEYRGYFTFAQRGGRLVDSVVTSMNQFTPPERTSLRALLNKARDPDVQRGLALVLHVMGAVGAQALRCAEVAASGAVTGPCVEHVPVVPPGSA
ncbi:MAG: DUF1641 domain-containing protein [Actinobacteria bacterium]|nr:DUF1641 domain-containing protein [Actinomycetota bacterium]